ncbi:hypothetical protein [Nannocystis punicea]|uniref:Uncharacterized protein n=1 Tax=Nannocystis punicea TaxID=2995304 RepID=A0ABY7GUB3_9BACT|nr:hypothetical protein [Nannocystis poenicansa]WAS90552.1 hypothetical protein O0S08_30565 [Nannocystis poenicansa]
MHTMSDPSRIFARVLELLASLTRLSLHAAAGSVTIDPEDRSAARAARQAGCFTRETADELRRLSALDSRVLLGTRGGVLDRGIVDGLGEQLRPMRAPASRGWRTGVARSMPRLATLPRFMSSALSLPSPLGRGALLDRLVVTHSTDSRDVPSRCEHPRVLAGR